MAGGPGSGGGKPGWGVKIIQGRGPDQRGQRRRAEESRVPEGSITEEIGFKLTIGNRVGTKSRSVTDRIEGTMWLLIFYMNLRSA